MNLFEQLAKKLNFKTGKPLNNCMTGPDNADFEGYSRELLNNLSKHALKLYEKQCDIKNFTKLVLSNPENTSHEEIVANLFEKGVKDPLENEKLAGLADNKNLLKDLGIDNF